MVGHVLAFLRPPPLRAGCSGSAAGPLPPSTVRRAAPVSRDGRRGLPSVWLFRQPGKKCAVAKGTRIHYKAESDCLWTLQPFRMPQMRGDLPTRSNGFLTGRTNSHSFRPTRPTWLGPSNRQLSCTRVWWLSCPPRSPGKAHLRAQPLTVTRRQPLPFAVTLTCCLLPWMHHRHLGCSCGISE